MHYVINSSANVARTCPGNGRSFVERGRESIHSSRCAGSVRLFYYRKVGYKSKFPRFKIGLALDLLLSRCTDIKITLLPEKRHAKSWAAALSVTREITVEVVLLLFFFFFYGVSMPPNLLSVFFALICRIISAQTGEDVRITDALILRLMWFQTPVARLE